MTITPTTAADTSADGDDGSLHYDVAAAYLAAGARVASWIIVSAMVYRYRVADYAVLGYVRYTILILNYTSLGLAPAMIRLLAEARSGRANSEGAILDSRVVYSNALALATAAVGIGVIATAIFARWWPVFLRLPSHGAPVGLMPAVIWLMGLGTVIRLAGDAPGALLQTRGLIGRDNIFLAIGEAAWVVLFIAVGREWDYRFGLLTASAAYFAAALVPMVLRWASAGWISGTLLPNVRLVRRRVIWVLLAAGGTILLAQLADYLYAPIDYVLINRYLDPIKDAAAYTPIAQVGSALLLVSSGLAAVLLPRSAVAHAAGDIAAVRRYYVRGTLASAAALALVATTIWLTLPMILGLWLGRFYTDTVNVMPIMLLASVVGGSGMVGRSVLIGAGKFGAFTASVLLAAVANVIISYLLVRFTGFGLAGVVLGTLAATAVRCAIWMPWYVNRMLSRQTQAPV